MRSVASQSPPTPRRKAEARRPPRPRRASLGRLARRWAHRLRRWLGVRRGFAVDGVYYKELSPESLQRALSKRGPGHKDYRVTFPDRSKQVVRCSRERVFADLMGPVGVDRLEQLLPLVRPGARVLEFGSGTGYRAHWLSFVVGPSGGVVALSENPEDVAFAQRRYTRANIAFEQADGFALAGETDGAFDGVVVLAPPPDQAMRETLLAELWRLTGAGGVMLVGLSGTEDARLGAALARLARECGAELRVRAEPDRPGEALLIKPQPEESRDRQPRGESMPPPSPPTTGPETGSPG